MVSGRAHIDAAAILPPIFIIDAHNRHEAGLRISLPAGRPASRRRAVRERAARYTIDAAATDALIPYGVGWLDGRSGDTSPTDPLRSLEYVVVDVETTGGAAEYGHRVTEVAAVRLRGDGAVLAEYATLVNPDRLIPPSITQLTRITQPMVTRAPRFHEIAADVERFLDGAVFVAHNASFDWRFLCAELSRAGAGRLRGRVLCTVRLARRVVPEISSRSLDALQFFFDVDNEARHRAFGDARATAAIFRKLLDRVDEREITCWEQLEALLARRAVRRKQRRVNIASRARDRSSARR